MSIPAMVCRWKEAWEGLDPAPIAALYASTGTHMSEGVVARMSRPDGLLTGPGELKAYAEASVAKLKSFRIDILDVIAEEAAGEGRASVEYWRVVNGNDAERKRVVEIIEWKQDLITACRVFHF